MVAETHRHRLPRAPTARPPSRRFRRPWRLTATATTEVKPPELSPEEKKKSEDALVLKEERAKWEADSKTELARWTPALHAEARALAEKSFTSGKAAIVAAMAGKHRKPGADARDKYRHPAETLELFGFKPTMTVVDIGPGEGWYTELLAPALSKKGKYIATNNDPNGPIEERPTFYGQRFKAFLDKSPELYGSVQTVIIDPKAPKLGLDGTVDMGHKTLEGERRCGGRVAPGVGAGPGRCGGDRDCAA